MWPGLGWKGGSQGAGIPRLASGTWVRHLGAAALLLVKEQEGPEPQPGLQILGFPFRQSLCL